MFVKQNSKISIELESNRKKLKDKDLEISTLKENIKKYHLQLDAIKNNKEYKALNNQIASLTEKISNLEAESVQMLDEEAAIEGRKKESEACLLNAKQILNENEDKLKKEIIEVDEDIVKLRTKRNDLARDIPMSLVKKYAQLIKNKNRKAVVFFNGTSCGGCGFNIRPQLLIEINQNDKVNYCENCGRIIAPNSDN